MANHKRGKPKNARAGCLMCKFWKINGVKKHDERPYSEMKKRGMYRERY